MSQENVEVVRSLADALRRGNSAAVLAVLDADVEWHDQAAIPGADVHLGREAVARHLEQWFETWEKIEYTPEEILDRGDRVVVVIRRRGKGKGSGVEVSDQVIHVYTVRGEKIVRFEGFSDRDAALAAASSSE